MGEILFEDENKYESIANQHVLLAKDDVKGLFKQLDIASMDLIPLFLRLHHVVIVVINDLTDGLQ
jgi:hypothetical protein